MGTPFKNTVFLHSIFKAVKTDFVVQQLLEPKNFCQKYAKTFFEKPIWQLMISSKGVRVVPWDTQEGPKTTYRVRISRQDAKGMPSKPFDSLDEAKESLALPRPFTIISSFTLLDSLKEERYRLDQ